MAKAKDVLQRIVVLLEKGRIKDEDVQSVLNGAIINNEYRYQKGMLQHLETGAVTDLSPEKILTIAWPISKPKDVGISVKATASGAVMRKSDRNN